MLFLLSIADESTRSQIQEELAEWNGHETVICEEFDSRLQTLLEENTVSCWLVDEDWITGHQDDIAAARQDAAPLRLPVLLVTDTPADPSESVWTVVDDVARLPMPTKILRRRLENHSEIVEREAHLHSLQRVSRAIVRAQSVEETFRLTIDAITELFDDAPAGCWRYNEETERLEPMCQSTTAASLVGSQPVFDHGEGLAWRAFSARETAVYSDVHQRDAVYNATSPFSSEVIVPVGDVGVLAIAEQDVAAFDAIDVELAEAIAAAAATAVERVEFEADLQLFKRAVEETGNSVMITDREGILQYVNPAFEEITGYTRAETIGETPRLLNSGKHDEEFYERMWSTILAGDTWRGELTNEAKSGQLYQVQQTIAPIRNNDGEITHFVSIEVEVTERKLREQRLAVLNRILRHNIRNGMNLIGGYAELLEEEIPDPDLRKEAHVISQRADALEEMSEKAQTIEEIFDRDSIDNQRFDVKPVVEGLVSELRHIYPDAEITIEGSGGRITGIEEGIRLAVWEAIDNAIVYSDAETPRVWVSVSQSVSEGGSDVVEICVSDEGPVIPAQEQDAVLGGEETPLDHASGIGLWIISWVASEFGGELAITQNDAGGNSVILRLPAPQQEDEIGENSVSSEKKI